MKTVKNNELTYYLQKNYNKDIILLVMNLLELINKTALELSGERAKRTTHYLSTFHRIQASKEFHTVLEHIQNELTSIGDEYSQIHEYIADGTKQYYDWETPISWDIDDGTLELLEPTQKMLCRFSEVPESVCTHSKSVNLITEVVHVGKGKEEDFKDIDVKGKVVLTTAGPRTMIERLSKHGAIGIIAYPSEQRAQGHQEMIQYVGLWPRAENVEQSTFGFSLSRKQALELIEFMNKGKPVKIKADIKAELYKGKMHVLSTKIKGDKYPEEEIIVIAHICHPAPSANDNASGSALLLETYRTIMTMIEKGVINHPERTIRFLWVPEFHGTIPWIMEQEKKDTFKPLFCINLDMVGEHPALVGYPFTVNKASISTPTFINDLITECIEHVKDNPIAIEQGGWQFPWNYRIKPFAGGSDHLLFNDAPLRIPSVMFGHSDTYHHTNLDTIEKVDQTTLKRVGIVTACTVISSCYRDEFAKEIQKVFLKGIEKRKGSFLQMITNELELSANISDDEKKEKELTILNLLMFYVEFEKAGLHSIDNLFSNLNSQITKLTNKNLEYFEDHTYDLTNIQQIEEKEDTFDQQLGSVPKRLWKGPFSGGILYKTMDDLESLKEKNLSENQISDIQDFSKIMMSNYGGLMFDIINMIDDKRSILEIALKSCLIEWKIINPRVIGSFFELLRNLELVEY